MDETVSAISSKSTSGAVSRHQFSQRVSFVSANSYGPVPGGLTSSFVPDLMMGISNSSGRHSYASLVESTSVRSSCASAEVMKRRREP